MQGFAWHGIAPSLGTYVDDNAGRHKLRICAALSLPSSAEWTARISDPNPASQHENGPRVLFQDPGVLCMCIGHSLFEYKHRSLKHYSHPPATQTSGLNVCLSHRKFTQVANGFIEIVRSSRGRSFAIITFSSVSHAELRGAWDYPGVHLSSFQWIRC